MDLKGPSGLDPKLKETYERVMGTSFTPPATQSPSAPTPQPQLKTEEVKPDAPVASVPNIEAPLQPPPVKSLAEPQAPVEQPQPAAPLPLPEPISQTPAAQQMVQSPQVFSEVNPFQETTPPPGEVLAKNAVVANKKSNNFVLIGLILGGAVFFVLYAFIWAKVFGLF